MPPNPATLPHSRSHRKVVGFKGQECSYITVCECAQKEQSLRALKYIYVYTYCGMMKLATQRAQLQIISIMTTATKPNKVQKALEICNSKLSIAYFWALECQYWRTRTPHNHSSSSSYKPRPPISSFTLCTESRPEFFIVYPHTFPYSHDHFEGFPFVCALFFNEIYGSFQGFPPWAHSNHLSFEVIVFLGLLSVPARLLQTPC